MKAKLLKRLREPVYCKIYVNRHGKFIAYAPPKPQYDDQGSAIIFSRFETALTRAHYNIRKRLEEWKDKNYKSKQVYP